MSEGLDAMASQWQQIEAQEEADDQGMESTPESPQQQHAESPDGEAGDMAAFAVGALGGILKIFEPRLDIDEQPEEARAEVGPVVAKYELHKGGSGTALGFQPEISAGLYVGRFIKNIIRQFKHWRQVDSEKENDADQSDKREYRPAQHAHGVSGDERLREKPDTQAQGGDPYEGLSSDSVG